MDISIFTERVRELRGDRSQREVAEGIGITQQTYGRYENGARRPDLEIIERMAVFFEVSADYLLGLKNVRTPDYNIQAASGVTGLSQETIEHIWELIGNPMFPEAEYLLNMIIQYISPGMLINAIKAHDHVMKIYTLRSKLMQKYNKEMNTDLPLSLLDADEYDFAEAQRLGLSDELEKFALYFDVTLILYYETQFKEPDSDDEKQRLIYYAQSKEYAGLQMDLSNLMRTSLERSVVERMRRLEQELFQRGEYLNDATEEVFGKICDEILKVNGKDVMGRIHSVKNRSESDESEDSMQSDNNG